MLIRVCLYWEGALGRALALPRGHSLGFYSKRVNFLGYLWPNILTQDPSLWCVHCSAKIDSSEKDPGRLVGIYG